MEYWGYHLIFDCRACDIDKITNRDVITKFVKALVVGIDMKAYGEPIIEHFATHDPNAAGHSLLQLIETSSITGHFVDKNGDAYLDIFSCKPFDLETARQIVVEYFNPEQVRSSFFVRDARERSAAPGSSLKNWDVWTSTSKLQNN